MTLQLNWPDIIYGHLSFIVQETSRLSWVQLHWNTVWLNMFCKGQILTWYSGSSWWDSQQQSSLLQLRCQYHEEMSPVEAQTGNKETFSAHCVKRVSGRFISSSGLLANQMLADALEPYWKAISLLQTLSRNKSEQEPNYLAANKLQITAMLLVITHMQGKAVVTNLSADILLEGSLGQNET